MRETENSPILATMVFLAACLLWMPMCCGAAVELRPGTIVEFASVEEGRQILAERETGFIQAMSQFDRCVRMRTSRAVTEAEFVTYITNQVRAWSASEEAKVTTALNQIRLQIQDLNFPLPSQFFLVKSTGNEEANAAYLRGTSMILPQTLVSGDAAQLTHVLTHELFHEYMYYNPHLRGALYGERCFAELPETNIPEMGLLTESEWLEAVEDETFESEEGLRRTLSSIRAKAKNKFGNLLHQALRAYVNSHDGQLPRVLSELAPYFETPVNSGVFDRWTLQNGQVVDEAGQVIFDTGITSERRNQP